MFTQHVVTPAVFASRFAELLPEYLPGVDTGAFEPTDRRRCWNKTLNGLLTVIGKEDNGLDVVVTNPAITALKDQSYVLWQREGVPVFAMVTGWGDRSELEISLQWLEAFKCPQKLLVYTCSKWQDAVLDQIRAALNRYPYHVEGEEYLFMNLLGAESRFHLFAADFDRSGRQPSGRDGLVKPVNGSPFSWHIKPQLT